MIAAFENIYKGESPATFFEFLTNRGKRFVAVLPTEKASSYLSKNRWLAPVAENPGRVLAGAALGGLAGVFIAAESEWFELDPYNEVYRELEAQDLRLDNQELQRYFKVEASASELN